MKAFRCDICKKLTEEEVAARHPNKLGGYGDKCYVSIKVSISGQGNCDVCEACVAKEAGRFLKREEAPNA